VITLESLTRHYGEKVAVDGLSLEVAEGEVCMLIGPSGCGKTTTLRMINRLIEPTGGRILIDGRDVRSMQVEELRRGLGYAIQSTGLFPHLSVAGNIGVVPRLLGWSKERIAARAGEMLELVGLDAAAYAHLYPRQLSGGEAQRVGVARALAADPPVLLMDEPFGAVDPLNRERLQAEFGRIQRELKKTVVFVTHDIDEAVRLADRIAVMRDGRLEQYDTPEALLDRPANRFVHDFIGADRALKRLSRVRVAEAMTAVIAVPIDTGLDALRAAVASRRFAYATDAAGRLVGWLDAEDLRDATCCEDAITHVNVREVSIAPDATLRDALSRMLGLGFRSLPVTDVGGLLVGEVTFEAIELAMAERDPA
jgi:osmoprotectant transport system ATP-binding protein